MTQFKLHTIDSAPDGARPVLEAARSKFGFAPNLLAMLAESPAAAEAYLSLSGVFGQSTLSPVERQVVLIAASVEHDCHYCVAAHSGAAKGAGMSDDVLGALRDERPIDDARLEALRAFTLTLVRERGWAGEADVQAFLDAGFTRANVFDVITGIALKTISNYTNHIADTPLDAPFKAHVWSRRDPVTASERV